jgi:quercetin dioxygenase-like cupin family protein
VGTTLIAKDAGSAPTRDELDDRLKGENLSPRWWSNGPGDEYGWHEHPYHKVVYCQFGSIRFQTQDDDIDLQPGDRLEIEPETEHAATVGGNGCVCVEAARYP